MWVSVVLSGKYNPVSSSWSGKSGKSGKNGPYLVEDVARVWMIVVGGLRTEGVLTPLLRQTPLLRLRGRLDVITGSVVFTCGRTFVICWHFRRLCSNYNYNTNSENSKYVLKFLRKDVGGIFNHSERNSNKGGPCACRYEALSQSCVRLLGITWPY